VEELPFPKVQLQAVGLPEERSWKFTTRGEHPETGVAEKFAMGAWAATEYAEKTNPIIAVIRKAVLFSSSPTVAG
jgi:hypothetical protein